MVALGTTPSLIIRSRKLAIDWGSGLKAGCDGMRRWVYSGIGFSTLRRDTARSKGRSLCHEHARAPLRELLVAVRRYFSGLDSSPAPMATFTLEDGQQKLVGALTRGSSAS